MRVRPEWSSPPSSVGSPFLDIKLPPNTCAFCRSTMTVISRSDCITVVHDVQKKTKNNKNDEAELWTLIQNPSLEQSGTCLIAASTLEGPSTSTIVLHCLANQSNKIKFKDEKGKIQSSLRLFFLRRALVARDEGVELTNDIISEQPLLSLERFLQSSLSFSNKAMVQCATGSGFVALSPTAASASMYCHRLESGQTQCVPFQHIVAWTATLRGTIVNADSFQCEFKGPGYIYLQSLSHEINNDLFSGTTSTPANTITRTLGLVWNIASVVMQVILFLISTLFIIGPWIIPYLARFDWLDSYLFPQDINNMNNMFGDEFMHQFFSQQNNGGWPGGNHDYNNNRIDGQSHPADELYEGEL